MVVALVAIASLTLAGNPSGHAHGRRPRSAGCARTKHKAKVPAPRFVRHIPTGETGWFSSPGLVDLNGDGRLEIVAPDYSTFVFDANGRRLGKGTATKGRVYAPGVVADLDGDRLPEIVVGGNEGTVAAYNLVGGQLQSSRAGRRPRAAAASAPRRAAWRPPTSTATASVEVVVTTTNTSPTGSQVFVFDAAGRPYRPAGAPATAWPRYNTLPGAGNDADFNGVGNHGYGAYGENVGIGNLDDDPQLEIVVTFDNHQINVFNHDGTSVLASPWFTNRQSDHVGARMGWGQFIRWLSPKVEADHYHRHVGPWPDVRKTRWLQWTASPPSVADLDGDGHNEVIGLPNAEMKEPYETQNYAFMVLDGAQNGGARSARRHRGFTNLPLSRKPAVRGPRRLLPAERHPGADRRRHRRRPPAGDRLLGPRRVRLRDRPDGQAPVALRLRPRPREDLRLGGRGRRPQPRRHARARLRDLRAGAALGTPRRALRRRQAALRHPPARPGRDGNGIGVPAAPSIADLDGDGRLEIVLSTFDHGLDVYRVPGLGHELPAVADRARQPAAQRHGPRDRLTSARLLDDVDLIGVGDQVLDRHHLERPRVRRPEHHAGAQPASRASSQRAAHTHQRSPGESPGKPHSGRGVERSLPASALNSRNSAVMTAQTVWLPTSSGPVAQQPSR